MHAAIQLIFNKEHIMSHYTPQPALTPEGVIFTVRVDSVARECLVTGEALQSLSALKHIDEVESSSMNVFHAFEATINGVARRLVTAGVPGTPLMMRPNTFSPPHTS
jgi:capsule polysaccharide export protein KpsC/LpsZ